MAVPAMEFQVRDTKLERFLPKNQHTHRKLLNFEFWINGELSKRLSKSIFYVKNHPNLPQFFSLMNTNLGVHFLLLTFFDRINFWITLLLKWCPIFDKPPLIQNSKFDNFLWVCQMSILMQKSFWFCIPRLKTPQPVLPLQSAITARASLPRTHW